MRPLITTLSVIEGTLRINHILLCLAYRGRSRNNFLCLSLPSHWVCYTISVNVLIWYVPLVFCVLLLEELISWKWVPGYWWLFSNLRNDATWGTHGFAHPQSHGRTQRTLERVHFLTANRFLRTESISSNFSNFGGDARLRKATFSSWNGIKLTNLQAWAVVWAGVSVLWRCQTVMKWGFQHPTSTNHSSAARTWWNR